MKTIGDKTISQNTWVYDLVTKIVSSECVAVTGRRGYPSIVTRTLPSLPNVYHTLEPTANPPKIRKIKDCKFHHHYTDNHPKVSTDDKDV